MLMAVVACCILSACGKNTYEEPVLRPVIDNMDDKGGHGDSGGNDTGGEETPDYESDENYRINLSNESTRLSWGDNVWRLSDSGILFKMSASGSRLDVVVLASGEVYTCTNLPTPLSAVEVGEMEVTPCVLVGNTLLEVTSACVAANSHSTVWVRMVVKDPWRQGQATVLWLVLPGDF